MLAEWWEDLATGHASIDNPKRELFRKINTLLSACEKRNGRDEVGNLLQFLKSYVKTQFGDEESLQLRHRYPLYKEHREEHNAFMQRLIVLEEEFSKEGPTLLVILAAGKLALDWVREHVYQSDRMMAEFVANLA